MQPTMHPHETIGAYLARLGVDSVTDLAARCDLSDLSDDDLAALQNTRAVANERGTRAALARHPHEQPITTSQRTKTMSQDQAITLSAIEGESTAATTDRVRAAFPKLSTKGAYNMAAKIRKGVAVTAPTAAGGVTLSRIEGESTEGTLARVRAAHPQLSTMGAYSMAASIRKLDDRADAHNAATAKDQARLAPETKLAPSDYTGDSDVSRACATLVAALGKLSKSEPRARVIALAKIRAALADYEQGERQRDAAHGRTTEPSRYGVRPAR